MIAAAGNRSDEVRGEDVSATEQPPAEEAHTERRRHRRVPIAKLAMLEEPDAPAGSVMVVDLSESGARLKTSKPPQTAVQYVVHFRLNGDTFPTSLVAVRDDEEAGRHLWGCEFRQLTTDQLVHVRKYVHALTGSEHSTLRSWSVIKEECRVRAGAEIVVAYAPSGAEIRLPTRDCLHLGAKGIEQFVHDVVSLKS